MSPFAFLFRKTISERVHLERRKMIAKQICSCRGRVFAVGNRARLHQGPDTIDELLDRHLQKKNLASDEEDAVLARRRLTSTRREALSLYRDIIRATRFFLWPDARGLLWRDVLRENARKEFEEARFEKDPQVITRLLIGGRHAVQTAIDKLIDKQKKEIDKKSSHP